MMPSHQGMRGTSAPARSGVPSGMLAAATRRLCGTVTGVSTRHSAVALTFDDGPHPEHTPRLLEILSRHGARATFFMVGEMASRHPGLVKAVADAGHAVGNHTWDHPSLPRIGRAERRAQLRACAKALAPYGTRILRPTFGHLDVASHVDALLLGYRVVAWSASIEDWLEQPAEDLARRLARHMHPGNIILLHDALYGAEQEKRADRSALFAALDRVLGECRGKFEFVTVPELFKLGTLKRKHWYRT